MKVVDTKYDEDLIFPTETEQRVVYLDKGEKFQDALERFSPKEVSE